MPGYRLTRLLGKDLSGAGLTFVLRNVSQFAKESKAALGKLQQAVLSSFASCGLRSGSSGASDLERQALVASLCVVGPVVLHISGHILRIRSIAEHFALPKTHILNESSVIHPAWWESFLLAPHHVSLHLDHHLLPYIPWYRLPKLHKRLLATDEYQTLAHVNSRFFFGGRSLLADITRIPDDPSSQL
ncbi:MAG TPA: fatty acid desaturase [Bryobacteraceae bacterium]|nr:fatty acid desaturase [Bryobacteraceae bacterium]